MMSYFNKYDKNSQQIHQFFSNDENIQFHRTIMSAQSQLAGMFPLQYGYDVSKVSKQFLIPPNPDLDTSGLDNFSIPQGQQPVPIHVQTPQSEQQLLGDNIACQNSEMWIQQNFNDPDRQRIQGEFQPLINKLIAIPQLELSANTTLTTVAQLVDTLTCLKWEDNPSITSQIETFIEGYSLSSDEMLEPINKDIMWVQMNLISSIELQLELFKTTQQKKTSVTPFMNELLAYFHNSLNAPNNDYFKWIMLSAHDTTIAMVSQGLNLTDWQCMEQYHLGTLPKGSQCIYTYPGFASNIIFELYQDTNNKPFIKALYNGTEVALCNTSYTYCYLEDFETAIKYSTVANYNEECGNLQLSSSDNTIPNWIFYVLGVTSLLLIALIVSIFFLRSKMKRLISYQKLSEYSV